MGTLRLAALLSLCGCTAHTVETGKALIDTRGVPIVQVVIEGPGGDLVPVTHEVLTTTAYAYHEGYAQVIVLTSALVAGLIAWVLTRREQRDARRKV